MSRPSPTEQVEERKDAGQSPKNLFGTGETQTKTYEDKGEAVAYVLGYDSEFEFTGEYLVYNFTAREPDPVHATGIQFTQGWNNSSPRAGTAPRSAPSSSRPARP